MSTRLTRKQVREAHFRAVDMITQLGKLTDAEVDIWIGKILPSMTLTGDREEKLLIIIKDILYRSFDHLGDSATAGRPSHGAFPLSVRPQVEKSIEVREQPDGD